MHWKLRRKSRANRRHGPGRARHQVVDHRLHAAASGRHHTMSDPQAVHLNEVLQANQPLLTVYILRDELKRLWFYRRPGWAQNAWEQRCEQASQSRIPALELFAQRLKAYWHGIISVCLQPDPTRGP